MSEADELFEELKSLFGEPGGTIYPGNVMTAHRIVPVCRRLMEQGHPALPAYFASWEDTDPHPHRRLPWALEQRLVRDSMPEAAWMLARLQDDVYLRGQGAGAEPPPARSHSLCNLALVGRSVGSATLQRHYALLSSAGDVHQSAPDGLGPALTQPFESHTRQYGWRDQVRRWLEDPCTPGKPVYLEALLACRWFVDERRKHVLKAAAVCEAKARPFVEMLLASTASDAERGTHFEAAAGLLLDATPGFEVYEGRLTSDEEVDLAVRYEPEPLAPVGLERGLGLVECKSSLGRVTSEDLRNFGAKCAFHRVRFGVLVAREGITGKPDERTAAELVRRRFQVDGLLLLVVTAKDMEGKWHEMRGLAEPLGEDLRELVFGPRG